MANRYANLIGANKIKDEFSKINDGFQGVQDDVDEKVNKSGDSMTGLHTYKSDTEIVRLQANSVSGNPYQTVYNSDGSRRGFLQWNVDGRLRAQHDGGNVFEFNGNEVWHAGNLPAEAGLWTPQIVTTGAVPTVTYTDRNGYYVRTGRLIKCNFYITCTITGGGGFIEISGLPFSPSNFREVGVISRGVIGATPLSWAALGNVGTVNRLRVYDYQNELVQIGVINNGQVFGLTGSITYQI